MEMEMVAPRRSRRRHRRRRRLAAPALVAASVLAAAGCGDDSGPLETAEPGVVFAFPADGQLDVPTGTRVVVTFSGPVAAGGLGACDPAGDGGFCLVGPDGPVSVTPAVVGDGRSVEIPPGQLAPGATYALHVAQALAPFAKNLPEGKPLLSFTTRSTRPRSAPPAVIAVNGTAPDRLGQPGARPLLETTTIQLVFSEPLDPRSISTAAGSVELLADGAPVPATVIAEGIHVSIDPVADLTAGATYQLRLGNQIVDLSGQALAPVAFDLVPERSRGAGEPIREVLRTRQVGDPGPAASRAAAQPNVMELVKPLIGHETVTLAPSVLGAELGDPTALGGPIAFTIRRGQRLRASGLDVKLGGEIPVGLSTGDLQIELLTDAGGRMYRNPHQPADQRPENAGAPLYVDLSMDLAVYATDAKGNAALTQTILGVQASGTVIPTQGVLAIEAVAAMDLGLLGVTSAPMNFVLELITSPGDAAPVDTQPPALVATYPAAGSAELPVNAGVELIFDEPVDLDRLRAGGARLETGAGAQVPAAVESHGAAVVLRPLAPLQYGTTYRAVLSDVADAAGNAMPATAMVQLATPALAATSVPPTLVALTPGAPCALTGESLSSGGRCIGGASGDSPYHAYTLERDRPIEAEFSAPLRRSSVVLGPACGSCSGSGGSVCVEELSAAGACVRAVPGALMVRERGFSFVPDAPWSEGAQYRLSLKSGGDASCAAGELCGASGVAASLDPLGGTESGDAGGPALVIEFSGAPPSGSTAVMAQTTPWTDVNGSGFVDAAEVRRDENRALLKITGITGSVSSADFTSPDCVPSTPEHEACMYLSGALPVEMGEVTHDCPLPGGGAAPACVPVRMSPQAMYATSVTMNAVVISLFSVDADTGTSVMRIREPASGPVMGYIIDGGAGPKLVAALDLYMDAPDMTLPLGTQHDLHSKPLSLTLEGPVTFLPDGRIVIAAENTADLPVEVTLSTALGRVGSVKMSLPKGEMKLRLVSRPLRGVAR